MYVGHRRTWFAVTLMSGYIVVHGHMSADVWTSPRHDAMSRHMSVHELVSGHRRYIAGPMYGIPAQFLPNSAFIFAIKTLYAICVRYKSMSSAIPVYSAGMRLQQVYLGSTAKCDGLSNGEECLATQS